MIDVLIITALREELEAARKAGVTSWQEHDGAGAAPYLLGSVNGLSVALARATAMGGRSIGAFTAQLVVKLQPRCLAMSGVCAGNPARTAPGDVIVADPAYEYDEGLRLGEEFRGDHRHYPQDNRWLRAAQEFVPTGLPSHGTASEDEAAVWYLERLYRGQDPRIHPARTRYFPRFTWEPRLSRLESDGLIAFRTGRWSLTVDGVERIERVLADDVDGPDTLPFAVLTGPMASGSAVVRDPAVWDQLTDMGERKILALEMEAATIATVAHDNQVPHWLVAKGVMDNADFDKEDRFKEFAARASAEVLFALLTELLPPVPADASTRAGGAVKLLVVRRLQFGWQDLADVVGVPSFEQRRFPAGDEPRALWEWLEDRGRLPELPGALDAIDRSDLADLLRSDPA